MKKIKLHIRNLSFISLLSLMSLSCQNTNKNAFEQIKYELKTNKNIEINNFNKVFIFTDFGCIGCNISFFQNSIPMISNDSILFYSEASGTVYDISILNSLNQKNVIQEKIQALSNVSNSKTCIIHLSQEKIDSITYVNPESLTWLINQLGSY